MPWLVPVLIAALQSGPFFGFPNSLGPFGPFARARVIPGAPAGAGSTVCETRTVPQRLARNLVVIGQVTRCGDPSSAELQRLERLCNLDLLAYGQEEGRARCRARLEASPEFRASAPRQR